MKTNLSYVGVAMVVGGFFACGGSVSSNPPANQDEADSGSPEPEAAAPEAAVEAAPVDHGAPSTMYPAFTPDFGQIQNQGGYVMKNPIIVPITWNGDASQPMFDSFADTIGGTAYWQATTGEYGVGPASSGTANHVHLTTAVPGALADSDIQNMVTTNAGTANGWPAPTADTVYAFFLAPGTLLNGVTQTGDACSGGVGGYHGQVTVGTTVTSYAVVPPCNFKILPSQGNQSTASMSHELIEAATDPQPQGNLGYIGFNLDPFAFEDFYIAMQLPFSEIGDACEIFNGVFYQDQETTPAAFSNYVQRTWSNKAGAAGHDPCVPQAAGESYFNVAPLDAQTVNVSVSGALTGSSGTTTVATKGYRILAGTSGTFQVGFYSDATTNGPWEISASAGNPIPGANNNGKNKSSLTVSLDKTTGQNGEKAWVTVKVATTGTEFKGELVTITSYLNGASHYMPVWIAGQ